MTRVFQHVSIGNKQPETENLSALQLQRRPIRKGKEMTDNGEKRRQSKGPDGVHTRPAPGRNILKGLWRAFNDIIGPEY